MLLLRLAALLATLFLIGACVRLGNVQKSEPVRTLAFSGSAQDAARCTLRRLGGKLETDRRFNNEFVVYDSVKADSHETGVTHYAITFAQESAQSATAELRVRLDTPSTTDARTGAVSTSTPPGITERGVERLWKPVEDCAAKSKRGA